MVHPKIYVLNAMASGLDTLNLFVSKMNITGIIGLDTNDAQNIANYSDTRVWANRKDIAYISVSNYSLKNEEDIKSLRLLDIDILVVTGWQRLIPKWLIEQCKIGVIGAHGSPWGITKGRGRSPQNWAIMMGQNTFSLSAFLIQPGADDGPVLDTKIYQLNNCDDIVSSYVKTSWLYAQMIIEVVPKLLNGWRGKEQINDPEYLPQRYFEDGRIDWNWSSVDIDRQIRALTKPYPGAWTTLSGRTFYIWKAQPIEEILNPSTENGEIIALYPQIPAFLVKTGAGALLVREWESVGTNTDEKDINSVDIVQTNAIFDHGVSGYEQLRCIFNRHQQKYPDKKLSKKLVDWAEKRR